LNGALRQKFLPVVLYKTISNDSVAPGRGLISVGTRLSACVAGGVPGGSRRPAEEVEPRLGHDLPAKIRPNMLVLQA
jgi:hypothetical protein